MQRYVYWAETDHITCIVIIIISIIIIIIIIIIILIVIIIIIIIFIVSGFDSNFKTNSERKLDRYRPLVLPLSSSYQKLKFVNVSMSTLGALDSSCDSLI